jgi:D-tyrosyl-tRNA(Tyr) deacylase
MKVLLQRVSRAAVRVDGETVASIGGGLLVLLGVERGDLPEDADELADKTAELRIFADDAGRMNRSVEQSGGSVLVVSQFTLAGTTRKGRRPSFHLAAEPERAEQLYARFADRIEGRGVPVARGVFQAMMEVELVNDGPVTLLLDPPRRSGEP